MTEESARIRLPFEVDDSARTTDALEAAGATVMGPPVMTPWGSVNARPEAPADLQMTVFHEPVTTEQQAKLSGFDTDDRG